MYTQTNVGLLCCVSCGSNVAVSYGVGLRRLACWDCGFESRWFMDVCLLWVLCVVRQRSLQRADHSYRGVLPTVVCRVWSRNPKNEEAVDQWGLLHQIKNAIIGDLNLFACVAGSCIRDQRCPSDTEDNCSICELKTSRPSLMYQVQYWAVIRENRMLWCAEEKQP